jgi:hypothetical protein
LSDYLVLLSIYQTCKYRGVSFLKFLLSREDDVAVFCQLGRKKKGRPPLEVYPEGFPRKSGKRLPKGDGADAERSGKVRWKQAILAFLRARPETGASRSDIAEYCVGLIRSGILFTAAPADDRLRVNKSVSMNISAMKKAGEVVRGSGHTYSVTSRGLTWLGSHSAPTADTRPPVESVPVGEPETTAGRSPLGTPSLTPEPPDNGP